MEPEIVSESFHGLPLQRADVALEGSDSSRALAPDQAPARLPRVLALGPLPPPVNGLSKAFETIVDGLRKRGWQIAVVDLAFRGQKRDHGFSGHRAWQTLGIAVRISLKMKSSELLYVTISQSALGFLKDGYALTLARWLGVRSVVHLHGGNFPGFYQSSPRMLRWFVRRSLSGVDRFVVLAESLKDQFDSVSVVPDRISVVPNPCDAPILSPRRPPDQRLRMLFLSNLVVEKGYLDVLAAAPLIADRLPGWKIEIDFAGSFYLGRDEFGSTDDMQRDFLARAAAARPRVSITWHGVVTGQAKQRLLADADVFVLPTYFVNEGQPIAILEALAAGLPIVTTSYRAIPETIPKAMHELMVPPRDPRSIADSIAKLASRPEFYRRCSEAALERACAFRPEAFVDRLEETFRAVHARDARDP